MDFVNVDTGDQACIRSVLEQYGLGCVRQVGFHSGTAAKSWRVSAEHGEFILRTRGSRTSSDALVQYDHDLRRHLIRAGIPTAAPLPTRKGDGVVRMAGHVLELYPFIRGSCVERTAESHVSAAAAMLARFHEAARTFEPATALPPVAQYRTLGFEDTRSRMEDPGLLTRVYERLSEHAAATQFSSELRLAHEWLRRLRSTFDDSVYNSLPHTVTHGDYTPANLLFSGHRVVGVFDFDWARRAPRVRDLADGLFFISGTRLTPLVPGDIWSLTEAVDLKIPRVVLWLQSYHDVSPITHSELKAIPLALAARWLSVRVEGMAKVSDRLRMRFALAPITKPLMWLDGHWPEVEAAFAG